MRAVADGRRGDWSREVGPPVDARSIDRRESEQSTVRPLALSRHHWFVYMTTQTVSSMFPAATSERPGSRSSLAAHM